MKIKSCGPYVTQRGPYVDQLTHLTLIIWAYVVRMWTSQSRFQGLRGPYVDTSIIYHVPALPNDRREDTRGSKSAIRETTGAPPQHHLDHDELPHLDAGNNRPITWPGVVESICAILGSFYLPPHSRHLYTSPERIVTQWKSYRFEYTQLNYVNACLLGTLESM